MEKKSFFEVIKTVWLEHRAKITVFVTALISAVINYFVG